MDLQRRVGVSSIPGLYMSTSPHAETSFTHPTFEKPVPLSQIIGARIDMAGEWAQLAVWSLAAWWAASAATLVTAVTSLCGSIWQRPPILTCTNNRLSVFGCRSVKPTLAIMSSQPGQNSYGSTNASFGGGPRQEMEYLCAGMWHASSLRLSMLGFLPQIAVPKTRSNLENLSVAGSVGTV